MSDDDLLIPRPVGLVADRHREIQQAYCAARGLLPPFEALNAALQEVLGAEELEDVVSFANGDQDSIFGAGAGEKLVPMLLGNLEPLYQQLRELGGS